MKKSLFFFLAAVAVRANAQELFPYTEPASNMPSKSVSFRLTSMFEKGRHSSATRQRYMPELMFGLNKKWMVHAGLNFSDMHEQRFIWEGARFYAKYRFLSKDEVHRHFRMAAFAAAAYSRNHLDHNELNLMGDQSGLQYGLIATQLWNKLAVSGTGSMVEVLDKMRWKKDTASYAFTAIQYSLSAGLLVLPVKYKNYDQTNLNLYVELLGSRNLDHPQEKYFVDLAPSVQAIFKSTGKLSIGYRFQLSSDIYRLSKTSLMVSYEHIFLGALHKKRALKDGQ
jgi:hypothetical protein